MSTVDRTEVLLVLPAAVVTLGVVLAGLVPAFLDALGVGGPDAPSVDASQALDARALTDGLRVTLGVATASTALALIVGYAGAALVLRTRAGVRQHLFSLYDAAIKIHFDFSVRRIVTRDGN